MDSWPEVPDRYKHFSRLLSEVLDDIVLSPAERDQNEKHLKTWETLQSFVMSFSSLDMEDLKLENGFHCPRSSYVCGSQFEGTTTSGLQSDIDILNVVDFPVVTNITDAKQYQFCWMLVQDPFTPAGYAKLQRVYCGVPTFVSHLKGGIHNTCNNFSKDAEGRLVFRSDTKRLYPTSDHYHGPAATIEKTLLHTSIDNVFALRCNTLPDCAGEWITRQRHHNWPTEDTIEKCKTLGCFFVRVGHPNSSEKHLEWRISFSLQERLLVTDFNSVQLKCYILLKMIKRERIHATLGEKSLTSYHIKTCILYMIENTPAEFWVEDNLLACLYNILYKMQRWVEAGECPNYFIPRENMFEGRLTSQLQVQLSNLLRQLLSMDLKLLPDIKCDMLGKKLQEALDIGAVIHTSVYPKWSQIMQMENQETNILFWILARNYMFKLCEDRHTQVCFWRLYGLKSSLERTEIVSKHTLEALSLIIPWLDIMLMSVLIVLSKRLSKSSRFTFTMLKEKWDASSFNPYRFNLKLKQASLMHMLGYSEMSLTILEILNDQIRHKSMCCWCTEDYRKQLHCIYKMNANKGSLNIPDTLFGHLDPLPCSLFLPAEGDLTLLALCYEMCRSVGSPPEGKEYWHNWAVVDGKVLLYFLLYLNHQQLGMEAQAAEDIDNIRWLILTNESLSHRETAFNLLGWIYKESGHSDKAMECFQESLAIKPTHNAALLLLAFEICAKINNTEGVLSK